MDAYQQQPPHHRYMRPPQPPPPSTADPYHYSYHYQQQPPPAPPPGHSWYPNQFQYHPQQPLPPPSSHHSPSPPPPSSQWAPHPPQQPQPQPPPPPLPYPAHPNAPPPPSPRPHMGHSQIAQTYPNQEWSNPNWNHQQSWDYSAHGNAEDWAARAREWAAAKAATADQYSQTQFIPAGISEGQSQFHDQYHQAANSHYPASSYQQYPAPPAPPHRPPMAFPQDTASISSGLASYAADGRLPYTVRDGSLPGDSNTGFSNQETLPTSSSIQQQEVPSSYSSVTGTKDTAEKEQIYTSLPFSTSSAQDGQYLTADLSDQPLDFAPRFNHDHDRHMQSSYAAHHDPVGTARGIDPVVALPPASSWTPPAAPAVMYPAVPPSGPQHEHSLGVPSFGNFSGSSFQPTIPSAGAPFGLGAVPAVHPTAAFPGDTYVVPSVSERPKKAAMPNWLKEEIIKNKSMISKSSLEHPKEETQSIEDYVIDKSIDKEDHADSKSIDSSRSTEEDDDDEDYVEAARTAAINQEIKRVLTEVLLKVTDELFDEIATKVISEDDMAVEVHHNPSNRAASSSLLVMPASRAPAKVLVPSKAKESEPGGLSEKSGSSSPGDVLGLGNYASDDEDDDGDVEIQSSSLPNSREDAVLQQSSIMKVPEDVHDAMENGHSQMEHDGHDRGRANLESDGDRGHDINIAVKMPDGKNGLGSKDTLEEKVVMNSELAGKNVSVKPTIEDSLGRETKVTDKNDHYESRRSTSAKELDKEVESSRNGADENRRRLDEKHYRKENKDDRSGSKEQIKEQGLKVTESESRKRFNHHDHQGDRKDTERHHRASGKEDTDRKRERAKDKEEDRSRHKLTSDSSRHKRRRSPSISSRDRNSKDNSLSHANDSSDEVSDDSKRKLHSRKRNLSPSPVRSRRRQVSRSPHSKHSQRRHSPYSSLETSRRRRSRSRSPTRRHR